MGEKKPRKRGRNKPRKQKSLVRARVRTVYTRLLLLMFVALALVTKFAYLWHQVRM
jgi:hypothetical protein